MTKRSEMRIIMKDREKINNNMENDELEDDDLDPNALLGDVDTDE